MRHKYPYILVIFILLASIYLVLFSDNPPQQNSTPTPSPTAAQQFSPYRASFLIFTNGTRRLFTASMYHNLSPDVYIENSNPSIVHVKKEGITWKDFFSTLPMGLTSTCLITGTGQSFCTEENESTTAARLSFILNGKENPSLLEEIIQPNDKLLVSFGRSSDTQLQLQYDQIPDINSSPSAQFPVEE